MNVIAAIRRRQRRWVPRIGGLLAVVWLNMVLQPCAMALGQHEQCPHCPPAMHGDEMHEGMHEDPMHSGSEGCATEQCSYIDRFDYDGRLPKVKLEKDLHDLGAVLPPGAALEQASASGCLGVHPTEVGAPAGPPLNVRFCVYLN